MVHLDKSIRIFIKNVCIATSFILCFSLGQTAYGSFSEFILTNEDFEFQISGTVSPATDNITHLYFVYGTGESSLEDMQNIVFLGEFSGGETQPFYITRQFSNNGEVTYHKDDSIWWYVAGVYGQTNNGVYDDNINGVTLAMDNLEEGKTWFESVNGPLFDDGEDYSTDEAVVYNKLVSHDLEVLGKYESSAPQWFKSVDSGWAINNVTIDLYSYSVAAEKSSTMTITTVVIPEPLTIFLLVAGSVCITCRPRNKIK